MANIIKSQNLFAVLPEILQSRLSEIILLHQHRNQLQALGLPYPHKILLEGPVGSGKTLTATILAEKLHLPLHPITSLEEFRAHCTSDDVFLTDLRCFKGFIYQMEDLLSTEIKGLLIIESENPERMNSILRNHVDCIFSYALPQADEIIQLVSYILDTEVALSGRFLHEAGSLSQSNLVSICNEAKKIAASDDVPPTEMHLLKALRDLQYEQSIMDSYHRLIKLYREWGY